MLRIYLHGLEMLGFDFDQVYPMVTWMGWVPNLLFVEWMLRAPARVLRSAKDHGAPGG